MGKVLRADSTSGDAIVKKYLAAGHTDVWVTFRLLLSPAAIKKWMTSGNTFSLMLYLWDESATSADNLALASPDTYHYWTGINGHANSPAPDTAWHTLEFHYVHGGTDEFFIDSASVWTGSPNGFALNAEQFDFGTWAVSSAPDSNNVGARLFVDDVKIGTSRGASDLFSDNFASGTLAAWTETVGDVAVVEDPTGFDYAVTYDGNSNTGGTAPVDPSSPYSFGATVDVLGHGSLTKTGHRFVDWNTQADGSGDSYNPSDVFDINDAAVTLYAQWVALHAVTYHGHGNTSGTAPIDPSSPYAHGDPVPVLDPGSLTKTGSSFLDWNTLPDGSGTSYSPGDVLTMPSARVNLYAQWVLACDWNPATTPYDADGGAARTGCWAEDLSEFLGGGGDGVAAALKSADGITWETAGATPWDTGGRMNAVIRSVALGLYIAAGAPAVTGDPAVATAPDSSTSWTGIPNTFFGSGFGVAVTTRASDDAILVAGQNADATDTFAISTDDTATWVLTNPLGLNHFLGDVAVRPSDDLILVVGFGGASPNGVISTDGGATWVPTDPGGLFAGACVVRSSDGALVVVGVDSDDFHQYAFMSFSSDSGTSWTYHNPISTTVDETSDVHDVAVRSSDGALVLLGFKFLSSDFVGTYETLVGISLDDGSTWSFSEPFGAGLSTGFSVAVRASDDAILVVGAGTDDQPHLAVTTDSGSSWTLLDTPFIASAVAVRDSDDLIAIGGEAGQVAVSADGGTTWTHVVTVFDGPYSSVAGMAVRADGALVAAGYDTLGLEQVSVSSSSGASWAAIDPGPFSTSPNGDGFAIACKQGTGAVVVGLGGSIEVIATSSDGVTFDSVSSPFDGGQVSGIDYSPSEDRWIAAGTDFDAIAAVVAYSDDDGATWTAVANPMDISLLFNWGAPSPPRVYRDEDMDTWWLLGQTVGGMSLARSDDGGITWTEVSSPLDPAEGVGAAWGMARTGSLLVLCGVDGTLTKQLCVSSDAGASWSFDVCPSQFDPNTTAEGLSYSPSLDRAVVFGNNPS